MRLVAMCCTSAAIALAAAWLCAGRQFTSAVDRLITIRLGSLPVSPVSYDGGGFVIGRLGMTFGTLDNQRFDLVLRSDPSNQIVLSAAGRSFNLGLRINQIDPSGRPDIDIAAGLGDQLSLTASRSVLGWPTPFEFDYLMRTPWWKRYVYYRLIWRKHDGAKLEMLWRYEQHYYLAKGWEKPAMMWNWHTGLLQVDIESER